MFCRLAGLNYATWSNFRSFNSLICLSGAPDPKAEGPTHRTMAAASRLALELIRRQFGDGVMDVAKVLLGGSACDFIDCIAAFRALQTPQAR